MKQIASRNSLEILSLWGKEGVTDAGLAPLEGLTNLAMLNLHPRRAFKPALNRLKQTLPGLSLLQTEVTGK